MADELVPQPTEPRTDAAIDALRSLIFKTTLDAVTASEEVREAITALQRQGYVIVIQASAQVRWKFPAIEEAQELARQRRVCPPCALAGRPRPVYLRGTLVRERVAGEADHEAIEEAQVRFHCSLCGYGELVTVRQLGGEPPR